MVRWNNQFVKPRSCNLINQIDEDILTEYKALRKYIQSLCDEKFQVTWLGQSLKWCEVHEINHPESLVSATLVLSPEDPRVMLTYSTGFFEQNNLQSIPRGVYVYIEQAITVGHQTWCTIPLNSVSLMSAVEELIQYSVETTEA